MDLYAPICRNIVAPLWALKERSPYLSYLRKLERSQYRSLDEVLNNQLQKLRKIIKHAWDATEYYNKKWKEVGFEPDDFKILDDLTKLPILTKDDIRSNKQKLIAKNFNADNLIPKKTSGSTGVSLEFFVDDDSLQWKRGCTLFFDQWSGWRMGEKIASIWGNPTHNISARARLRNTLLERYDYLDTLKMNEESILSFYKWQLKRKPTLLFGHAHSIYLFANFLKHKSLPPFKLKGIISSSMVLHDFERRKIEEVFHRKVFNRYGCEEVSLIACECEKHEGLHMNLNTLYVEFIKDGRNANFDESGAILITDLTNFGMPFIRYKVGDIGTPSDHICSCGRKLPLMKRIEGRAADYVVTADGSLISGISLTENFAMKLPEIKQLQIIQEKIDRLSFKIVKGQDFSSDSEVKIRSIALERFGPNMTFICEYVDNIPQEANGKYRFCISKVKNPLC